MPIRVHNFGGVIGWNAKKYIPWVASESYLKLQFVSRRRSQKEYIAYFMSHEEAPHPLVVNLETVNRCNSTVIITRKSKSQSVNFRQVFQIKFTDVLVVYTFGIITTDVIPICFAGVFIVVICPLVDNLIVVIPDIGIKGAPRNSSGAAEQFS